MRKCSWSVKDCFIACLIVAGCMFLFHGFLGIWTELFGIEDPEAVLNEQPLFWVSTYILQAVAFLLGIFWVVPKWTSKQLGFRPVPWMKGFGLVVLVFLINIGVNAFYLYLKMYFDIEIPGYNEQAPHIPMFGKSVLGIVSLFGLAVIAAPLLEELFFRGFLLQGLFPRFGKWGAILISSVAFAVVHFEFANIVPLFILSLLLGWMFVESNSLWPPIAFHAFNNSLALIVELMVY